MDSYWDLYVAYVNKCERENYANGIDPNHYEMEWNHWLPKACFPDLPLGQYLTLKQHAIASALQTLALNKNCMCGWHKKHLPEKLLELAWPLYCIEASQRSKKHIGELNSMFGKRGELNPNYGKKRPDLSEKMSGELHPMFGKKNPEQSERMKLRTGELNPMFGRTGELNPMFGVRLTGELHPAFGTKWWVNAEGETYRGVESPGPEWQLGRKFKQTEVK